MIEKSNTARVNRPTPRLSEISAVSEPKAKQQFFVKVTGQDFVEPETVFLEVTGEGLLEKSFVYLNDASKTPFVFNDLIIFK